MPKDLFYLALSSCGLDIVAHNGAQPDWLFPALGSSAVGIGRPYIIGRLLVWGQVVPLQQVMSHVLVNQRPSHAYMEILEIEILPFQPSQFAPACPDGISRNTIALSRIPSA